jgi:signal transduction histidine kinase/CheY-like chemotaxis protein
MTISQPVDEHARLEALYALQILDTSPEPTFDRITRLAQKIFGVPMAAISLVDRDRQWFKSRIGVSMAETPREESFCSQVIRSDEVMVVPDALSDPTFCSKSLVASSPNIRFYAGAPLRNAEGYNLGALCVMDSVARPDLTATQREMLSDLAQIVVEECNARQREHLLRAAKVEADRANKSKGDFLSRASHELRTPMNAVLGFTQLLEMDDLSEVQRSNVNRILKAGKHLLKLVNEVLEISRIESGGLAVELEPVKIGEAIREAAEFVEPLSRESGISIRIDTPETLENMVLADQQKLTQVFLNLLSNAIKYNRPNGSIVVAQELLGSGQLRINFTDTGNGISAGQRAKLFQPFERLGADRTKTPGTGLGLSLAKKMVELMGGSIGVDSVPGSGSTFWVQFALFVPPAAVDERKQTEIAVQAHPAKQRTVLYIEDAVVSIHLIKGILKCTHLKNGGTVRLISAMQGNLGLEMARVHAPDLILLDLHLPDLSGIQVLNQLKADARTSSIPVVVLTADPLPGTRGQVLEAGALACLDKPVDVPKFLGAVSQILEETTT